MDKTHCPHQWTQGPSFTPAWAQFTPSIPVCPPTDHTATPNPDFPTNATLPMCTPLQLKKVGPRSLLVTISISAESTFTLPTKALEIKLIRKNLKITQSRFFNSFPSVCGIPHDTSKLFLGGFIRKDIQYSEATRQTATTVEGSIKDFVIDIPFTCAVDLGRTFHVPQTLFNHREEYEYSSSKTLPAGFSSKDRLVSGDLSEYNILSQESFNTLPECELIFSQINEMDDALDRVPLPGGPFEEGVFKKVQEKMVILIQFRLNFKTEIEHEEPHCNFLEPKCRETSHPDDQVQKHQCSSKMKKLSDYFIRNLSW